MSFLLMLTTFGCDRQPDNFSERLSAIKDKFRDVEAFTGDIMLGETQFIPTQDVESVISLGETVLPELRFLAANGTTNQRVWSIYSISRLSDEDQSFIDSLRESDVWMNHFPSGEHIWVRQLLSQAEGAIQRRKSNKEQEKARGTGNDLKE